MLAENLLEGVSILEGAFWYSSPDLPGYIFTNDNASSHIAGIVKNWKEENGIILEDPVDTWAEMLKYGMPYQMNILKSSIVACLHVLADSIKVKEK